MVRSLLLGAIEIRYATSTIASYGGLAANCPHRHHLRHRHAAMIGLPMLSGFIGEFVILSSTFALVSRGAAIAAALGVILGAATCFRWCSALLRTRKRSHQLQARPRSALRRTGHTYAARCPHARHGPDAVALAQLHPDRRSSSANQKHCHPERCLRSGNV